MSISVILLSGGKGTRFGGPLPKQYLPINEKAAILHSFETFVNHPAVSEIIVVCEPSYRSLFPVLDSPRIAFAEPGALRQDSVYQGLEQIDPNAKLVCVHDGARPFLSFQDLCAVLSAAEEHGAATLGIRAKNTIKEGSSEGFIAKSIDRAALWEMQTPQVFTPALLRRGFELAQGTPVTDDNSIVELTGHPIKIVESKHCNIKITTGEDLLFAQAFAQKSPLHV